MDIQVKAGVKVVSDKISRKINPTIRRNNPSNINEQKVDSATKSRGQKSKSHRPESPRNYLIMKLDTKAMRYLAAEDWRVLTAVSTCPGHHGCKIHGTYTKP
jgi:hypothetical protein